MQIPRIWIEVQSYLVSCSKTQLIIFSLQKVFGDLFKGIYQAFLPYWMNGEIILEEPQKGVCKNLKYHILLCIVHNFLPKFLREK